MNARWLALGGVLALVLSMVLAAKAQGDPFLTCFNLPDEDCALLVAATENSADVRSFTLDFTADIAVSGLPGDRDSSPGRIAIHVTGGGPFTWLESAAFPPLATQIDAQGTITAAGQTDAIDAHLTIVNGILYVLDSDTGAWEGRPIAQLLHDPAVEAVLGGFLGEHGAPELPPDSLSLDQLLGVDLSAALEDPGLASIGRTPGFIDHQRLPDVDMNGQTMHVFRLTVDSDPLLESPEFHRALNDLLRQASTEHPEIGTIRMLLPGVTVRLTHRQYVGADDLIIHGRGLELFASLDLSLLTGASGGRLPPPITLDTRLEIMIDSINEPFAIAPPEGGAIIGGG